MHIIIDKYIPYIQGVFEPFARVTYSDSADINNSLVANADALIVRTRTKCNADLLEKSNIKFIATATIGYDHIDTDYCNKHNIAWCNAAGCNAQAVVEYIEAALRYFEQRNGIELQGKTIGVVGVGHIGKLIVELGKKMNMKVLQCDPPRQRNEKEECFADLETIARESDIVTFHTPLNPNGPDKTHHLCNNEFLDKLKGHCIIINAARGGIVDEKALKNKPHIIQNTVLDCWENEPHIDAELCQLIPISTSHIAGYSQQGKQNATTLTVQAVARHFGIKELVNWQAKTKFTQTNEPYNIVCDSDLLKNNIAQFEHLRSNYKLR